MLLKGADNNTLSCYILSSYFCTIVQSLFLLLLSNLGTFYQNILALQIFRYSRKCTWNSGGANDFDPNCKGNSQHVSDVAPVSHTSRVFMLGMRGVMAERPTCSTLYWLSFIVASENNSSASQSYLLAERGHQSLCTRLRLEKNQTENSLSTQRTLWTADRDITEPLENKYHGEPEHNLGVVSLSSTFPCSVASCTQEKSITNPLSNCIRNVYQRRVPRWRWS